MALAKKALIKEQGALVDLNVNPCKMCTPMGSCMATFGIQGALSILHGSQGCATYIRRHMATHYNEPIDIASSSLAEQETVYGGEENLHKGIDNLIRMYDPEVICVSTTCLAETIGEDVPGMLARWQEAHPDSDVQLVSISSPGYAGSQFEGFFRLTHAVISQLCVPEPSHCLCNEHPDLLNIICGPISPADIRHLKELVAAFGIDAVIFPDISQNLDKPHQAEYDRLPRGGTSVEQIRSMADAKLTLELSTFVQDAYSPALLLEQRFGIPFKRLNVPIGLRDIDALLAVLSEFSGREIPEGLVEERGRYIDAMIDSHKYNAEGRAAIFGEPDFCYSVARLCVEQGIVPVVVAVGSKAPGFTELLEPEIESLAQRFLVEKHIIVDQADFGDIERLCLEYGVNLMIGSSEARRIENKHDIPLVRCAFPIHDFVGGQRIRTIGYEGALTLLDNMTNGLIQRKHSKFRAAIRDEFYDGTALADAAENQGGQEDLPQPSLKVPALLTIEQRTAQHPCFNGGCASENARIHLPVAPKCNIACNYCVRKFDCVNESRPGVTSSVLTPAQALERFKIARQKVDNLTTVGIAGPGDALANWSETRQTLELIRVQDPNVTFCLSTNGLMLLRYANELAELGVTHVTVTVNSLDADIGATIYRHVKVGDNVYHGQAGAAVLLSNQIEGIRRLVELGIVVKVNTVLISGVNDTHVQKLSAYLAKLGVSVHNIMQMVPVDGAVFGKLPQVSRHVLDSVRQQCAEYLPQMSHCQQCRADAVGKLTEDVLHILENSEGKRLVQAPRDSQKIITAVPTLASAEKGADSYQLPKMRVAVASRSGMMVDTHFGHAKDFLIYEVDDLSLRFVERRNTDTYCLGNDYCADGEQENRLDKTIATIKDCKAVVSLRIGAAPQTRLKEQGIYALTSCDSIEDAVRAARATLIQESKKQATQVDLPELKEAILS